MTDERLILAIGRIERALSRLEARAGDAMREEELRRRLAALDARHQRLRARTAQAVDQLGLLLDAPRGG